MEKELTLVVMAAGMGSRFGGLKQAEPVTENGSAILDFSIYDAMQAGFDRVVFVIKHAIEEDFKRLVGDRIAKRIPVTYVYQELDVLPEGYTAPDGRTKPWGTGHAVLCTKPVVNGPFAVINADDYYGRHAFTEMAQYLKGEPTDYCMTGFRLKNTLSENGSVSRGVCEVKDGNLVRVVEHTNIRDCNYSEDEGKTWKKLDENTVVSMNLWGFTTDFYTSLEKDFRSFLDEHGALPFPDHELGIAHEFFPVFQGIFPNDHLGVYVFPLDDLPELSFQKVEHISSSFFLVRLLYYTRAFKSSKRKSKRAPQRGAP